MDIYATVPVIISLLGLAVYLAPTGELKQPGLYAFAVGLLAALLRAGVVHR